jgi:hypothetical protein
MIAVSKRNPYLIWAAVCVSRQRARGRPEVTLQVLLIVAQSGRLITAVPLPGPACTERALQFLLSVRHSYSYRGILAEPITVNIVAKYDSKASCNSTHSFDSSGSSTFDDLKANNRVVTPVTVSVTVGTDLYLALTMCFLILGKRAGLERQYSRRRFTCIHQITDTIIFRSEMFAATRTTLDKLVTRKT